jgi:5-methylcytosine-specific restriction endonuclease McrA
MKKCNKCDIKKSFESFNKASREKDGLQSSCRSCNKAYAEQYRKNNPEKERLRHAKYHAENKDVINARVAEWSKNNPDNVRARTKRFYENHKESEKERRKKWIESNPDWIKDYAKKYREDNFERFQEYDKNYAKENNDRVNFNQALRRVKKIGGYIQYANFKKIKWFYEESARLTIETGIEHHVDHIIPLSNKYICGLHHEDNLQILTESENSKKCNKYTPE